MIVDAHVHLFPEALARAIRSFFDEHIAEGIPYPCEADAALGAVRAAGVDRCWALPYVRKAGAAGRLNRWMAERFGDEPAVVAGAALHPGDDVEAVMAEAFDALGLAFAKLHCSVGDFSPDDAALEPLWRRVSGSGHPVVVHVGHAVSGATAAGGLAPVARVAERWPDARLIVAHTGAPAVAETLALLRRTRSLHADLAPVVTEPVRFTADEIAGLEDRILFGSDAPNVVVPIEAGIARVRGLGLAEPHERAILGGNAERLIARR